MILFGLTIIAQLSVGGLAKGLLAGFLGLLLATTGTDPTFGQFRGTFGIVYLFDQLPIIAVLVGLLGFSEVLVHAESGIASLLADDVKVPEANVGLRGILTGFVDTLKRPIEMLRAGLIGLGIGAMPGAGASVATFVSYQQSIAFAPPERKKTYGKGSFEGLIAADTTNNAVVGGALVPLLTLAIPGSGSMAVLLVVMIFHGLYVGPRLFEFSGDIAYAVLWSLFAGAFFVLVIGTILAYFAYRVALINLKIILPVIAVFCVLGSFAKNAYVFDMGLMVGFGCLGFLMKKYEYPVVPQPPGQEGPCRQEEGKPGCSRLRRHLPQGPWPRRNSDRGHLAEKPSRSNHPRRRRGSLNDGRLRSCAVGSRATRCAAHRCRF